MFVSRHPEIFISSQGINGPGLRDPDKYPNVQSQPGAASIITMDPPRHVNLRRSPSPKVPPFRAALARDGGFSQLQCALAQTPERLAIVRYLVR
jgi:hypothetical protein